MNDWLTHLQASYNYQWFNGYINIAVFIFHTLWNPLLQSFGALNDTRLKRARAKKATGPLVQGGPRIQEYHGGED